MSDLKKRASKALVWSLLGSYGGQFFSFLISILLARLLTPEDFGLVGMSMVFIGMLNIFRGMGFSDALVQNESNTSLTYSSVFFLNISAGLILTFALFFSAPFIGAFYKNPIITDLVRLLSVSFFVNSFNIVHETILSKKLDFKRLTSRNLISQLIAGIVAVVFAYFDYGLYALVIQQIVAVFLSTLMIWKITDWYPKWEFSWNEIKNLGNFSKYVFAASSVNKILEQLDTLIIGKLFSPSTLGFFTRANSLNKLIIQNSSGSITAVFFPTLVQVQNDPERFEKIYLRVINIVASVAVFLTSVFYLLGEELIIGLFGAKWQSSIPIFHILILKGFTFPISAMIVNAFMAKGKSKANFHFGNIRKLLQVVPLFIAYYWGFYPFLYAHIVVAFATWILNNLFAHVSLNIPIKKQTLAVLPHLFFSFIIVLGIVILLPNGFSYFWAVVKVIAYAVLFAIYVKSTNAPILKEGVQLIMQLKKRFDGNENK